MAKFLAPVIRAAVQAAIAFGIAYLALHTGIVVDPVTATWVIGVATAALTGLVARGQQLLERRYPKLGRLLHSPTYPAEVRSALEKARDEMAERIVRELSNPQNYVVLSDHSEVSKNSQD